MTFGTRLGAGLILDGKLYSGTNDNADDFYEVNEYLDIRIETILTNGYNLISQVLRK